MQNEYITNSNLMYNVNYVCIISEYTNTRHVPRINIWKHFVCVRSSIPRRKEKSAWWIGDCTKAKDLFSVVNSGRV